MVLSFPSQGNDQLKPRAGAKLFQSSLYQVLSGFVECLPVNSSCVSEPPLAYCWR